MKTISLGLSTHLDGEVTTIASCWRIVRTDGIEFFFTDHDQDIIFEGNTYEAESSYGRTAIESKGDFSVANLDVAGILDSDKISDQELRAGLFNRADVYIFIVNWQNTAQGALRVRRGWFGEVTLLNDGTFTTEIRGLAQALTYNFIEIYASECRADFCDQRCKLNIEDYEVPGIVDVVFDRSSFTLTPEFVPPTQSLVPGTVRFTSGENAGRVLEIIAYNETTRKVELFENISYPILIGTTVVVAPGCDGLLDTCKDYGNVINRRAEDYVPGNDEMLSYPDASS